MNLKKLTYKNVREGILNLSVEQQLKGKMIGLIGGIVGLILALITMIYTRNWGIAIFVFFIIWLQFISYIGTRQQYIQTKEMLKGLNTEEQDLNSPKIDKELGNTDEEI